MNQTRVQSTRSVQRQTFRQQLELLRVQNAARAFERGQQASELRHCVAQTTHQETARALSRLKQAALRTAIAIAPDAVRVGMDDDFHVGLLSVVFPGRGRLHLPPTSLDSAA